MAKLNIKNRIELLKIIAQFIPPDTSFNPPDTTFNPPSTTFNPPDTTFNPPDTTFNPNPPTTPTQTTPPTTYNAQTSTQTYNISSIPGFKPNLFRARPDMINYFNQLANFINKNLLKLSGGKVSIQNTYLTPAMSGSQFSNDLKHFVDLAKWLYYTLTSNKTPYYTVQGLIKFANDLIQNVRARSFIDVNARDRMVVIGQTMLATLKP